MLRNLLTALGALALAANVTAASHTVKPGETWMIAENVVLSGADVVDVQGTPEKPCEINSGGKVIRATSDWTGRIVIRHCKLRGLGAAKVAGLDLAGAGTGEQIVIEHCDFHACGPIHVTNGGRSATVFRNNTVHADSIVAITKNIEDSAHAFVARGNSREPKRFQGNFFARGKVIFEAPNWLVGGGRDADSNLFIGYRIGIIAQGDGSVVRGNYFHLLMPINAEFPYWSQISVFTTGRNVVGEHNVIRDGEWIVRFVEGEFRYNLVSDIIDHDLVQNGSAGRLHHNLFLAGTSKSRQGSMSGCIAVVYPPKEPGEGIEVFNNVFDGGDRLDVPGIEVSPKGFVKSVRSNVFFNFAHKEKYFKLPQAMIRPSWNEDASAGEKPARLGYADYNLFFNPKAHTPRNYLLSVAGKVERKDAGFGLNDIPRGGKVDEQADPRFVGPLKSFPFTDEDIQARKVTVSQTLAHYRRAYAPGEGSPLVGAGDPADGASNFIGAIGPGKDAPNDHFGRFGTK